MNEEYKPPMEIRLADDGKLEEEIRRESTAFKDFVKERNGHIYGMEVENFLFSYDRKTFARVYGEERFDALARLYAEWKPTYDASRGQVD